MILRARTVVPMAGEPIDNDYRLESATDEGLTIIYLPLNERQTLDLEPK